MSAQPRQGLALRCRPMQPADLARVIEIEVSVYPFPWTIGNFSDSLSAGYDGWVFESPDAAPGTIAGYAVLMWLPDEVHLLNLSVDAAHQGRGLGRAMLDWLCANLRLRGARSILLEVRPSNLPARRLYASSGFESIGLRRGYYPDQGGTREDALVMRKDLARG